MRRCSGGEQHTTHCSLHQTRIECSRPLQSLTFHSGTRSCIIQVVCWRKKDSGSGLKLAAHRVVSSQLISCCSLPPSLPPRPAHGKPALLGPIQTSTFQIPQLSTFCPISHPTHLSSAGLFFSSLFPLKYDVTEIIAY